jgi:hypothetical protein
MCLPISKNPANEITDTYCGVQLDSIFIQFLVFLFLGLYVVLGFILQYISSVLELMMNVFTKYTHALRRKLIN